MNPNNDRSHGRSVDDDARTQGAAGVTKACIVGASGKFGRYMVEHALDRRARERSGGGRERKPTRVEPARGRSHPRE
jgi:hypothetical protein